MTGFTMGIGMQTLNLLILTPSPDYQEEMRKIYPKTKIHQQEKKKKESAKEFFFDNRDFKF
jgi:hypothetical protein